MDIGLPPVSPGQIGRFRPSTNRIALIGHSMLARCIDVRATAPNRNISLNYERNAVACLAFNTKGQFRFPEQLKFAVSGSTVKDIYTTAITGANNTFVTGGTQLSNLLAQIAAGNVGAVYIDTASNNFVNGDSFAKILYGTGDDGLGLVNGVLAPIAATGTPFIVSAQCPRGNATYTTAAYTTSQLAVAHAFRAWVSGAFQRPTDLPFLYPGQGYGVDYWPVLADRAATTLGWGKAAYLEQDSAGVGGVHNMSVAGFQMYGKALPVFQGLGLPPQPSAIHQPGEVYDATNNVRGNLLTNGDILGGTAQSGTTGGVTLAGVRPTNHTVTTNGALQGGTSITITGSQVTGTATGDWYQIVATGNTGAASTPYFSLQLNPTMLANCVVGDVLTGFGEFEIGSGSTNLCSTSFRVSRTFPGGSDTIQMGYGEDLNSNVQFGGPLDALCAGANFSGTWNGDLQLSPWLGTETASGAFIDFILKPGAAFNVTVRVRNVAVRQITR